MHKELNHIFSKWRDAYSGTILVKTADKVLLSFAGGYAHKGFLVPNTVDTMFDAASVTKVFTAAAVLQLAERKLLRLEDRIADIIDLYATRISRDVTIEHLLTHTSGIADDADEEAGEDYAELFISKPNYSIRYCKDFLPQFAYKAPNFSPGTNVRYNNCAFILLGLAIEKITGTEYREYVSEHIFDACGMANTRFCAMDEVNPKTAEGYISLMDETNNCIKWRKNIYSYPPIGAADGGAYTTAEDLDIFIRAIVGGRLLSQEYSEMLRHAHCIHTRPHKFGTWRTGYGFEFIEDRQGTVLCMYKDGMNVGTEAMCSFYPQIDLTVNLLSNQNGCLFKLHRELQEMILDASR